MNLFPYNPGHVLVCPYRHVSLYVDLTDEETTEFTALTKRHPALEKAIAPMGFNIGMNQGAVAGRRGAAHLHQHVVPAVGWRLELPARHRPDQGAARCCSRTSGSSSSPRGRAEPEARRVPDPPSVG